VTVVRFLFFFFSVNFFLCCSRLYLSVYSSIMYIYTIHYDDDDDFIRLSWLLVGGKHVTNRLPLLSAIAVITFVLQSF